MSLLIEHIIVCSGNQDLPLSITRAITRASTHLQGLC